MRRTYWFWPSAMTVLAIILGFTLPFVDEKLGSDWTRSLGFFRAIQVDGARAILTTLAGAALGVAGVAFSITIVAVSFASSNYGPRLIGNFMADRTNQIVLGVFVATFVYCITVLSTVHNRIEFQDEALEAFVPQISTLFALLLTLSSVGALIGYIHHIPESINIMNLTASIGRKLHEAIAGLPSPEHAGRDEREPVDVAPWAGLPTGKGRSHAVRARSTGYLQRIDVGSLQNLARSNGVQVRIDRAAGDFLATRETVMTVLGQSEVDAGLEKKFQRGYTLGPSRTDDQDVLFLVDQLVEVGVRALSPGVNDPHTAMLCLDWLGAALCAFAERPPAERLPAASTVLYSQVTFGVMLDRAFDQMRQHVSTDRTTALYALAILTDIASVACRPDMAAGCARQVTRLAMSANEQLTETLAREDVEEARARAIAKIAAPQAVDLGDSSARNG
nr:DUF2254 domain-containing protein [uncultured Jannaschia sp.]